MSVCFSCVMGVKNGGMGDTLINFMSLFVISNFVIIYFHVFFASRGSLILFRLQLADMLHNKIQALEFQP